MTFFPVLMYYFWICLWFYDGKLIYPTSSEDIQPFLWRMWSHIRDVCVLACSRSNWLIRKSVRMPAPTSTRGKCTLATYSSNCSLHRSYQAINKKVFRYHRWGTKLLCITATRFLRGTRHWSRLLGFITRASSVSQKSSTIMDTS